MGEPVRASRSEDSVPSQGRQGVRQPAPRHKQDAADSPRSFPFTLSYRPRHDCPAGSRLPQPLYVRGCWIVADARVDNAKELCRLLPGERNERSDAELIADAYLEWGPRCLARVEGDFAFALWDPTRQRIFCARDPLGIRPFFYRWHNNRLVWASEVKALLADPDYSPAPDEALLAEYVLGWSDFPDAAATFFSGIRQLPAGHFLSIEPGRYVVRRYWDIDPAEELHYRRPREENIAEFRSLLDRAVRRRLETPGAVGLLLSGGLDSTSIACLALEAGRADSRPPLYLWNYYLPDTEGDERSYVRSFEQKYNHPVDSFGPEAFRFFDGLDEVARACDTPLLDPLWSLTRQWVARAHTREVGVVLTGFGGDNIFPDAQTNCVDTFRRYGWWRGRQTLHRWAGYYDLRPGPLWGSVLRALLPPRFKIAAKRLLRREIAPWVRRDFARRSGLLERVRQVPACRGFSSVSHELTYRHLNSGRLAAQLSYWDKLGAANDFEPRYPFFDSALVRFTLLTPWEQHTDGGEIKVLLRDAMRGLLPEPIRRRRDKGGADAFLVRWLRTEEAERLERLANQELLVASYIEVKRFREMVRSFLRGNEALFKLVWSFVSLEVWLRNHFGAARQGNALAG